MPLHYVPLPGHREKDLEGQGRGGGVYLGSQVFHQGHHGVLEECTSCQGALGHLSDVLLPIWPHRLQGGILAADTDCIPSCPVGMQPTYPG
jgi:hypothetical protein